MDAPLPRDRAQVLTRTLDASVAPLRLFQVLTAGRRDTLLFETADTADNALGAGRRSILLTRAGLRISARADTVTATALSINGRSVLDRIASRLHAPRHRLHPATTTP